MNTISSTIVMASLAGLATACLDPLTSDEAPAPASLLLPAGSLVPSGYLDDAVAQQIANNDGVESGVVPLLKGFSEGGPIRYWDFGESVDFATPIFILADKRGMETDAYVRLDHLPIIDSIPGDLNYSPFWAFFHVEVTDVYQGELITSVAAMEEAQELGLILAPVPEGRAKNCPLVAEDVTLQISTAEPRPPSQLYWRGQMLNYYDFGWTPELVSARVPELPMYTLRRVGEELLSEVVQGIDLTGDSDLSDTNNIFPKAVGSEGYSQLARVTEVVLPTAYQSIDSAMNDEVADFQSEPDIFNSLVTVTIDKTEVLRNLPQEPSQ